MRWQGWLNSLGGMVHCLIFGRDLTNGVGQLEARTACPPSFFFFLFVNRRSGTFRQPAPQSYLKKISFPSCFDNCAAMFWRCVMTGARLYTVEILDGVERWLTNI